MVIGKSRTIMDENIDLREAPLFRQQNDNKNVAFVGGFTILPVNYGVQPKEAQ